MVAALRLSLAAALLVNGAMAESTLRGLAPKVEVPQPGHDACDVVSSHDNNIVTSDGHDDDHGHSIEGVTRMM